MELSNSDRSKALCEALRKFPGPSSFAVATAITTLQEITKPIRNGTLVVDVADASRMFTYFNEAVEQIRAIGGVDVDDLHIREWVIATLEEIESRI